MATKSQLYEKLHAAAVEFLKSTDAKPGASSVDPDPERILAIRAPDFKHDWGHTYFKTVVMPGLDKVLDRDGFVTHVNTITPSLAAQENKIDSVIVDTEQRKVCARVRYFFRPKGVEETIENEIAWFLGMDESGEKVVSATEFVDPHAVARIGELIGEGKKNLGA